MNDKNDLEPQMPREQKKLTPAQIEFAKALAAELCHKFFSEATKPARQDAAHD